MTVKLNLGCGKQPMEGWVNVNDVDLPGVDVTCDLDQMEQDFIPDLRYPDKSFGYGPYEDDQVDEFRMSHVLEHLRHPLPLMAECWRIAKPDALFTILCPHGASDDADEDPTHVRRLYPGSFMYFAQPTYWRADYNYRGDWQPETVTLKVDPDVIASCHNLDELTHRIRHDRNVVLEMEAVLRAVKPAREPGRDGMVPAAIEVVEGVRG